MAESQERIETFAVLNIQTTGVKKSIKDITEICIYAISAENVRTRDNTQGIEDKLVMVFKPKRMHCLSDFERNAQNLSQLNWNLLSRESDFDSNAATAINAFLNNLRQPICLVAHMGPSFGFLALKAAFKEVEMELPGDMKCIDSLKVIKAIDGEPKRAYRTLGDVYRRCFDEEEENPHLADGKVVSLKRIIRHFGASFVEYAERHAKAF